MSSSSSRGNDILREEICMPNVQQKFWSTMPEMCQKLRMHLSDEPNICKDFLHVECIGLCLEFQCRLLDY